MPVTFTAINELSARRHFPILNLLLNVNAEETAYVNKQAPGGESRQSDDGEAP